MSVARARGRRQNGKLASFVYTAPLGDSLLSYKKNSRGLIVPKAGAGIAANFSCRRRKLGLVRSEDTRCGRPEPVRASVRCGAKARFSLSTPRADVAASTALPRDASSGPASIPIQNTRADFG